MAKKGEDSFWKFLATLGGIVAGTILLAYAQSGRGKVNDSALIPNTLESQIDLIVEKLNSKFGHQWVNWGLDALRAYLRGTLPWVSVALVEVVYTVEQSSKRSLLPIPGYTKKQTAVQRAKALA
jgi:hypothetical protein